MLITRSMKDIFGANWDIKWGTKAGFWGFATRLLVHGGNAHEDKRMNGTLNLFTNPIIISVSNDSVMIRSYLKPNVHFQKMLWISGFFRV